MARDRPPIRINKVSPLFLISFTLKFTIYIPIQYIIRPHTLSSIFGVHSEDSWLVDSSMDKARAIGTDVTTVHVVNIELQRTSCKCREK